MKSWLERAEPGLVGEAVVDPDPDTRVLGGWHAATVISYARENKPDVEALVRDLHALGYQTWVDSSLRGVLRVTEDDDVGVIGVDDDDGSMRTAPLGVVSGAVVVAVTGSSRGDAVVVG